MEQLTLLIPTIVRLRQGHRYELEASLAFIMRPCLSNNSKNINGQVMGHLNCLPQYYS